MKRRLLIFTGLFGLVGKLKMWAQETRVGDEQIQHPSGASAFWIRTSTGRRFIPPDTSIVIDLSVTPNVVRVASGAVVTFMDNIVPTGALDGVNKVFSLPTVPQANSMQLHKNGIYQKLGTDYTLSGNQVTFITAPPPGAVSNTILVANYRS